jgi:hypothetical protein
MHCRYAHIWAFLTSITDIADVVDEVQRGEDATQIDESVIAVVQSHISNDANGDWELTASLWGGREIIHCGHASSLISTEVEVHSVWTQRAEHDVVIKRLVVGAAGARHGGIHRGKRGSKNHNCGSCRVDSLPADSHSCANNSSSIGEVNLRRRIERNARAYSSKCCYKGSHGSTKLIKEEAASVCVWMCVSKISDGNLDFQVGPPRLGLLCDPPPSIPSQAVLCLRCIRATYHQWSAMEIFLMDK